MYSIVNKIGISLSKFYDWEKRRGCKNRHNSWIPRENWILDEERQAIIKFFYDHPLDGYRRLSFMMIDRDIVCVSPSTVYRVLKDAELIGRKSTKKSLKGTGFVQPLKPHEHWHLDISYINCAGTFYYLCTVIDGASRFIVHSELKECMKTDDVKMILQRAREAFPGVNPRIISDNGPQFIAKDFKEFIRLTGMTHVRTSPYYPQSNGKIERWHHSLKSEAIRLSSMDDAEKADTIIKEYIRYYNEERLHSSIGYITPKDMLLGNGKKIHDERDRKMEEARVARNKARKAA